MNDLLEFIPPLVAEYLPPTDALNLSFASKKLSTKLSFSTVATRQILTGMLKRNSDNAPHYGFKIPLPQQVATHSVCLSIDWKDQGWGNRKGEVFVVAEEVGTSSDYDYREEFGGRRVVYRSPIAPHHLQQLTITFKPKEHEAYHLHYKVGGGGGHSLHLSNITVQFLVFDDDQCYIKSHRFLDNCKVNHPWDEDEDDDDVNAPALATLLASAVHLFNHDMPLPPPMLSFFGDRGISAGDLNLQLLGSIEILWNQRKQEAVSYSLKDATGVASFSFDPHYVGSDIDDEIFDASFEDDSTGDWIGSEHSG